MRVLCALLLPPLCVAFATGLAAQETAPDIPDYVAPDRDLRWVGTWDINAETCADPASIYRLRLTHNDAVFGTGPDASLSRIADTFEAFHSEYKLRLADAYDRGQDRAVYRLVFPDSRPMMFLESQNTPQSEHPTFRRIYTRCANPMEVAQ